MQGAGSSERPPEVVRAIVENLRSFWRLRAEPEASESEGVIWWTSGGQRRALNGVLALATADPGPITDRIAATFRLSGLPCAWIEGPDPTSPELGLRLLGLGYRALEGSSGWALPLGEAGQTVPVPRGTLFRHGQGTELLDQLSDLVAEGDLRLAAADRRPVAQLLRPREGSAGAGEEIWIALADGAPVAGLLGHPTAGNYGVFALTTAAGHRGEGYATALLHGALRDAALRGYRWAVAEAPEAHAGPFRRLGFDEYCDFRRYGWEPHPHGPDGV